MPAPQPLSPASLHPNAHRLGSDIHRGVAYGVAVSAPFWALAAWLLWRAL